MTIKMVRLLRYQRCMLSSGILLSTFSFRTPAVAGFASLSKNLVQPSTPSSSISFSSQLFSSKTDTSTSSPKKSKKKKNQLFRADKVLSHRTGMTRSQAFDALKRRRIAVKTSYDSDKFIPVKGPKEKISMETILFMDGKEIEPLPPLLMVFHKPKYMLSAMDEKHSDKKHLGMVLSEQYKKLNIHPVGRLDYDTSGLLLFSQDGDLTQRLLHPKHSVEKEYVATCSGGTVDVELLKKQLEVEGVNTAEGLHFANVLDVNERTIDESQSIIDSQLQHGDLDEEKGNQIKLPLTDIRITVQEGKYRMVRRMLANCKHPVMELKRERHGSVILGDLKEGEFRHCNEEEIEWAESLLGLK